VKVSEGRSVNLLSRSSGEYKISEVGFHKRKTGRDKATSSDKAYRCSSREMHIFGSVASGSSSVVHRAVFIPAHRIMALKKINVFEKVRFCTYVLESLLHANVAEYMDYCWSSRFWRKNTHYKCFSTGHTGELIQEF